MCMDARMARAHGAQERPPLSQGKGRIRHCSTVFDSLQCFVLVLDSHSLDSNFCAFLRLNLFLISQDLRVFGPAKNQMMKPRTGSKITSTVHNTFLPVLTPLCRM